METWYLISYLFLLFFLISCIGYIVEVVYCSVVDNYFEWNRGFMLGPYIPIYGVGALSIFYLLRHYYGDPLALFLFSFLLCTVLEYVTSFTMEKLFKVRWWDYSSLKFNINGRVCLLNSTLFGVAGIVVVYLFKPLVLKTFNVIPVWIMISFATVCEILFLFDLIVTASTLFSLRRTITDLQENHIVNRSTTGFKDTTENTKDQIVSKIKKNALLYGVLIRAFPYIDGVNEKSFKELRFLINTVKKTIKAGGTVVNGTKKVAISTKDAVVNTAGKIKQAPIKKNKSKSPIKK